MDTRRLAWLSATLITLITSVGLAAQGRGADANAFHVDPQWPQPLPNHWVMGPVTAIAVDRQDHVWVLQRGGDAANAPPVLEFDPVGALVSHWGGPGAGYAWPESPGSIAAGESSVWIAGSGPRDAHALSFSRTGKFLHQIGKPGEPGATDSTTSLDRPAGVAIAFATNELFVADGGTHQRVVVFDAATGVFKRQWRVDDRAIIRQATLVDLNLIAYAVQPFADLSAISTSGDGGLVLVADHRNDSITLFDHDLLSGHRDARFGAGQGIALPRNLVGPQLRLLYFADGPHDRILVIDNRLFEVQYSFGEAGRSAGQFQGLRGIAVDSRGNVYAGDSTRVQKFVFR